MIEKVDRLLEGTYSFLQSVSGRVAWPAETRGRIEVRLGAEHEGRPCTEVTVMRTRDMESRDERYEFEVMCVGEDDVIVRQGTMIMPRSGTPSQTGAPIANAELNIKIVRAFLRPE